MPSGIVPAVIGIAVLVTIAAGLDWLIANPAVLLLLALAIGGGIYLWQRQKRARNRV